MMSAENNNPTQRHIYFKAYNQLHLLEKALNNLKQQGFLGPKISILGKVDQFYHEKNMDATKDVDSLKKYWKNTFDVATPYGSLYNPEIGNIFFVGILTSIFLNKVDGKTLGMLSVGPYAILRGLGASGKQSENYLKTLKSGSYLLIVRGYDAELENYKKLLDDKVNL